MTSLLLPFILLASPAPQKGTVVTNGTPNPIAFYWVGYSVDPTSIGASVSGPDAVTWNQLFSHTVSMSDSDTFVRNNDANVTQVKGTSKLLQFSPSGNNGLAMGHSGVRAFAQTGIDTTTFSDASVVKKVNYQASYVPGAPYPLTCPCLYYIDDVTDAYDSSVPWSGHTKDLPGVTVDLTVTVSQ